MVLAFVIVLPILASLLTLMTGARRRAGRITVFAMGGAFALTLVVARATPAYGQVSTAAGWLACDGLGALILVLVAFVGFTAALSIMSCRSSAGRARRRHWSRPSFSPAPRARKV
jgi:formate hydrogenlyase subunit 3/multisubunit Na+/H+ antiporter MnhD subunit